MASLQISSRELEDCQNIIQGFRVNELHNFLTTFRQPKLGKKQELIQRSISLLHNHRWQANAVQKIREMQASNRVRNANAMPYPAPSSSVSNGTNMHHQQMHANPYSRQVNAYNPYAYPQAANPMMAGYQRGDYYGQMSSQNSGALRQLRTTNLPFYDHLTTLLELSDLPAFNGPVRPGEAKVNNNFSIPQEYFNQLYYKEATTPLPRMELQLRIFELNVYQEQADSFPPNCSVTIDGMPVNLPPVIPTNKPNAEQKRMSRPVNITPCCQPPRSSDRPHRITIEWNGDKRAWAYGICVVRRVNAAILEERLIANKTARRPFENTRDTIIKRLAGTEDEDGIQMDTLKISLLCPLMKNRMKIPTRGKNCTHLQCFDLTNFLMMNEKRPVWKCGVCDNDAHFSKLIIDEYFESVLKEISASVDDVELLKDGSFRAKVEEMEELLSDEDDVRAVVPSNTVAVSGSAVIKQEPSTSAQPAKAKPKEVDHDVITISDSEDEEDQRPRPTNLMAPITPNAPMSAGSTTETLQSRGDDGSSSDHSVIFLDDEDASPLVAPSSVSSSASGPPRTHLNGVNRNPSSERSTPTQSAHTPLSNHSVENHGFPQQPVMNAPGYWNNGVSNGTNGLLPALEINGIGPLLRPSIQVASKQYIADNLSSFLQNIAVRNSQYMPHTA